MWAPDMWPKVYKIKHTILILTTLADQIQIQNLFLLMINSTNPSLINNPPLIIPG